MTLLESRWIRRLPLLLVAVVGIFFFMPKMPHDVEVDYDLGRAAKGLQKLEVEVLAEKGAPLRRTVFNVPTRHAVQHLRLSDGDYRAELELTYPDRFERRARNFTVHGETTLDLDVEAP